MNNLPPNPDKKPYILENHNDKRIDNYYWLRDDSRSDEEMLSYLRFENDYADNWFESVKDYQTDLVKELISSSLAKFIKLGPIYSLTLERVIKLLGIFSAEGLPSLETLSKSAVLVVPCRVLM